MSSKASRFVPPCSRVDRAYSNIYVQAYQGPDGTPRLFRPHLNMERMVLSAERVALPVRTPVVSLSSVPLTSTSPPLLAV